ncbi:MAG: FxLYD domain-containing protein, partial [Anaerolineales bacterium]|nr:FxLYD domain-containing protein [Anaerolineales bacterium]
MNRHYLSRDTLLILALVFSLLVSCKPTAEEEPPTPTNPPAATEAPSATAVPTASPTPEIPLGDEYRSDDGGFAFRTIPAYEVEEFSGFVSMMGPNSDPNLGPAIAFIGGLNDESATLEQLFEDFQQEIVADEDVRLANEHETTVGGVPGMTADLNGNVDGKPVNGRIVVALVTPNQPFTMFGAAPEASWNEFAPMFDAVLASVSFFEPVAGVAPPILEPTLVAEAPKPETAAAEIRQWASFAFASSEYSNPDWAASQATGEPDTLIKECADLPTAWASYDSDTAEWIELTYDTPVVPTEINIIQTHSPDQVVLVELIDTNGTYHEIYTGEPENLWDECPYTLTIPVNVKYEVAGLKISIDQSVIPTTWNEIDAVELVGMAGGETAVTPPKPETPAADGELTVTALRGYEDIFGNLHVVGLLTNQSARAVDGVEVEIDVLDAAGNSLYTEIAWMSLYKIGPGETSPFRLAIYDDLSGVDSFTANIVGQSVAEFERATIEVRGVVRTIDDDGNVHITGEMVNNGSEPAAINNVAAATFDGAGEIVTADSSIVKIGYLEPGESGPFRVFMYGPADGTDNIVDHAVYVDAITTSPETAWAITFSEENRVYIDRYDDVHLVGEVTNGSEENLDIRLLAAFYDADGNVLDADTFSMPLDLAPGDSLPFDIVGGWAPLEHTTGLPDRVAGYSIRWDPYWTWTSSEITVDLTTSDDTQELDDGKATFTGQIVNSSGTAVDKA